MRYIIYKLLGECPSHVKTRSANFNFPSVEIIITGEIIFLIYHWLWRPDCIVQDFWGLVVHLWSVQSLRATESHLSPATFWILGTVGSLCLHHPRSRYQNRLWCARNLSEKFRKYFECLLTCIVLYNYSLYENISLVNIWIAFKVSIIELSE